MQQSQHVHGLITTHSENYQVPDLAAWARDMQGPDTWPYLVSQLAAQDIRAILQSLYGQRDRFGVGFRLDRTKRLFGPTHDLDVVLLGLSTESHSPDAAHAAAISRSIVAKNDSNIASQARCFSGLSQRPAALHLPSYARILTGR